MNWDYENLSEPQRLELERALRVLVETGKLPIEQYQDILKTIGIQNDGQRLIVYSHFCGSVSVTLPVDSVDYFYGRIKNEEE